MRFNRNLGFLLLAIYLILAGAQQLFGLGFSFMDVIMGICALGAGIILLIKR